MILTFNNYSKSTKLILKILLWIGLGCFVFLYSFLFSSFIEFTDGYLYSKAYIQLSKIDVFHGYVSFFGMTGGSEPVSYLLFYIFSQFSGIFIFNNILNTCLLSAIFYFLYQNRTNLFIAIPLVLTNFYILLLEFGVMRLKIAVLFWVLNCIVRNKKTKRIFLILSALSHFQMLLIIVVDIVVNFFSKKNISINFKPAIIALIAGTFLAERVLQKIMIYAANGLAFPYKLTLLFIFSVVLIDRIKFSAISFILFFVAALIIGEERINILYFFFISYEYIVNSKRDYLRSGLFCLLCSYYSIKGIQFAITLIEGRSYF